MPITDNVVSGGGRVAVKVLSVGTMRSGLAAAEWREGKNGDSCYFLLSGGIDGLITSNNAP